MNATDKIPKTPDETGEPLPFSMILEVVDPGAFPPHHPVGTTSEVLKEENSLLRAKLRKEKRERRIFELRNRFHTKIEEILSGLDRVSDIRNLFEFLLYEAPKILNCEARFHFVGLGPFMENTTWERRTELFDDLSEIFKTSLVAYLSIYGNAGGRINVHLGNTFERDEKMEYIPVILENYRTDPGAKGRSHTKTEPLHTGTRTVIGYVEAWKKSNERRSFEPEAAAKKIMRSLRAHLEEISNGLLMEVHKRNACLDPLTEVLNRRGFFETVEKLRRGSVDRAVERGENEARPSKSSVIMLDLDHFKFVNDCYGHEVGDQALRYVAKTISECIEGIEGACVGRFWGEEFVVYLQGHDIENAFEIAEKIRIAIKSGRISAPKNDIVITASLGVSECQDPDEMVDRMCKRSDHAMYQAKKLGRNLSVAYRLDAHPQTDAEKIAEPQINTENRRLPIREILETLLRETPADE